MAKPKYRIFIHRHTGNLGDAIQTVALARLLGTGCVGVYRDEPLPRKDTGLPLIANGWLGHRAPHPHPRAVFAGVHIGRHEERFIQWMRKSAGQIGARDSYTEGLLRCCRVDVAMIGCATLTFDRYRGKRSGRLSIDAGPRPRFTELTNHIGELIWAEQWKMAVSFLDRLRRAELVYTTRLHVVLPCLAFGTPVVFPLKSLGGLEDKHRLTLLADLPFAYDEEVIADTTAAASRFVHFLECQVGKLEISTGLEPPIGIAHRE